MKNLPEGRDRGGRGWWGGGGWLAAALGIGIAVGGAGAGGAAERLTLSAAVEQALRHNPTIEASRARQEAAHEASREARLSRLPGVELSETGVRTNSPADVFGLQLMQERFSFPEFTAHDPNQPDPMNNFATQIQATLPLFTGGQLSGGIRQASKMAESAEAMRDHTVAAVELGVIEAYLNTLLADRFVGLAERAHATTAQHVEKAQDFFDAGMMVESDLLGARVQLSAMEENLIRARHAAGLARAGLNRAMGVAQETVFELEEPAAADTLSCTDESAIQQALSRRNDLRAVRSQVEAAEAGVGRARGEYWPQLGLAARYVWNDDRPFGGNGDSYTVAAVLQWKIWNWGQTRARVSRSRSDYAAAREGQRSYEQQVEFEARQARQGVEEARARLRVTAGGLAAAERALVILEDRFGQGIARMTDLLDAETRVHEARVRDTQAHFDLQRVTRTLRFAVGLSPIPEVSE